ncbi:MAG: SusD/RagB family nutrient-binding outer membrane lipoprotein [Chitinophagaceae bacterium]
MTNIYIKRSKTESFLLMGLLLVLGIGCTKNFNEINTPENQIVASNVDASLLGQEFAQAQYFGLEAGQYQVSENLYADIYAQYFATTHPNFNSDQYAEQGAWTNIMWNNFYSSPAPQLLFVENYTKANAMPVANAMAMIWRVEMYHRVTDYFGPIIYSQFGNRKTSVAYDSQQDVYHSFFKTLDSAVAVLKANPGGSAFGGNDQMYAGSADKWLKFANSLRLRLAIRLSYVEPALAKTEAEKAIVDGVISANADNANIISTVNSINWLSQWTYIDEFRMSATAQSVLVGFNDPRLSEYYDEAKNGGGYKGIRNGLPAVEKGGTINADNSFVDTKYLPIARGGGNLPNRVLSAAEVYFLRAEGALRGWNMGGTDVDLYNEGIRRSTSDRTSATAAQIETYLNSINTPVALNDKWNTPAMSDVQVKYPVAGTMEKKLENIITQKWIALYPDGWEAWTERRRTGYPKGFPVINSLNPNVPTTAIMRRLVFTTGEISTNKAAVDNARKLLNGPDQNNTKVWWDAK